MSTTNSGMLYTMYTQGKGDMDNRTFVKLCRDTGLLNKKFTSTDCDLIFAKVKTKGKQRITKEQFDNALVLVAERKKMSLAQLEDALATSDGPQFSGTVAQPNRFHDDKSLYTGVYAHGGPSINDRGKCSSPDSGVKVGLSDMVDRSACDVRGVNRAFTMNKT